MSSFDEAALLKIAEAEILGEAKRASARYSIIGVSGWKPCPKPNKVFLTNTLMQTMSSNRLLAKKREIKGEKLKHDKTKRKLLQKNKSDLSNNFVYQKPQKWKEKTALNFKTSKCYNSVSSKNKSQKNYTKAKKNSDNVKKVNK